MKESSNQKKNEVLVLDTGAFLAGFPLYSMEPMYTVPEVLDEVKDISSREKLEVSFLVNKVKIIKSSNHDISNLVGKKIVNRLSNTDKCLLNLVMDLKRDGKKPILVTDDYALQEAVKKMNLKYIPIRHLGIDKKRKIIGRKR